jgi:TusA-related sulfurtransferase
MSTTILDVRGTKCPVPIVKAKQALDQLGPGDSLEVHATDGGSVEDFKGWAATTRLATLDAQRVEQDASGATVYVHVLTRKS